MAAACAGGGGAAPAPSAVLSFEQALEADSGSYEPVRGFRAAAEPDWPRTGAGASGASFVDSRWSISAGCTIGFDAGDDALATSESPPLATRRLDTVQCPGRDGFWQEAGGRVYFWIGLAGGWSAEFYGSRTDDSTTTARRYALRRTAPRTWRVDHSSATTVILKSVTEVATPAEQHAWELTRALSAVGESDWATRPGAGTARSVAGTRWRDPTGCTLIYGTTVLARATRTQRLTRLLGSVACDSLRGSWQQAGKRVMWRVGYDSLTAAETYGDIVGDSLMRTRRFELHRASSTDAWQATWVPTAASTLRHVRR